MNLVQSSDELNHDKCQHRVAFLEEHTRELQAGLKGVRDRWSDVVDVDNVDDDGSQGGQSVE